VRSAVKNKKIKTKKKNQLNSSPLAGDGRVRGVVKNKKSKQDETKTNNHRH
jgi:hypothetical protein